MDYSDVDIDKLRLINGECLIEVQTWTENEVKFNNGTLVIVNKLKGMIDKPGKEDINSLVKSMKKGRYKDDKAMKEYMRMAGEQHRQYDEDKQDIEAQQAVRRGKLVKLPEKYGDKNRWDFECEFDGREGEEVWFDATYTRQKIQDDENGFEKDGKRYLLIPRNAIFAARRNDEIISLNGFILGEVLSNERKQGGIFMPESTINRVRVEVAPMHEPKFFNNEVWINTKLKKGDVVCVRDQFVIPLDSTLAQSTSLVRFQSRVILAIEE